MTGSKDSYIPETTNCEKREQQIVLFFTEPILFTKHIEILIKWICVSFCLLSSTGNDPGHIQNVQLLMLLCSVIRFWQIINNILVQHLLASIVPSISDDDEDEEDDDDDDDEEDGDHR